MAKQSSSKPIPILCFDWFLSLVERHLIPVCLYGATLASSDPFQTGALLVASYLPLVACACLGAFYLPAVVFVLLVMQYTSCSLLPDDVRTSATLSQLPVQLSRWPLPELLQAAYCKSLHREAATGTRDPPDCDSGSCSPGHLKDGNTRLKVEHVVPLFPACTVLYHYMPSVA